MPEIPIIIPIVITGLLVGSLLKSRSQKISRKKLGLASLLSGALNCGWAYVLILITPTRTRQFSGGGGGFQGARFAQAGVFGQTPFVITSFIVGLIFVPAIIGIALFYVRFKSRTEKVVDGDEEKELEDSLKQDSEEEF
jgi:hypothetical protein